MNDDIPYGTSGAFESGGWPLAAPGLHQAMIVGLCYKGLQKRSYSGEEKQDRYWQVFFAYSVFGVGPQTLGKEIKYTLANNKATLKKLAMAAFGVSDLSPEQFSDVRMLLGRQVTIAVEHVERARDDGSKMTIATISQGGILRPSGAVDLRGYAFPRVIYQYYSTKFGNLTLVPNCPLEASDDIPL